LFTQGKRILVFSSYSNIIRPYDEMEFNAAEENTFAIVKRKKNIFSFDKRQTNLKEHLMKYE
jgi:hypothetical protein